MRIGIDCRTILNPEKGEGAGIGHYVYQLVRHLLICDKKNKYFLFFDRSVRKKTLQKFSQDNATVHFFPFQQYRRFLPDFYSRLLMNAFISKEKLDIFHLPSIILPLDIKVATVITVHDLSAYKFPAWHSTGKGKNLFLKFKEKVGELLQQGKFIISPSLSTAKDIEEIFGIPFKKIKIIAHGVDERFYVRPSKEQVKAIKEKYGIKGKYLLFLGVLEERKNIKRIVSAYERFSRRFPKTKICYKLVLAGAPGRNFAEINKKIASSPYRRNIIVPGYIHSDDINPLFEGASVFVFPSLWEGFGLPVLEAMAKKVPVITSNTSSLVELSKGRSLLVDPYDISDIAKAMEKAVLEKDKLEPMIEKAYKYSKNFSWIETAKQTLDLYRKKGDSPPKVIDQTPLK